MRIYLVVLQVQHEKKSVQFATKLIWYFMLSF